MNIAKYRELFREAEYAKGVYILGVLEENPNWEVQKNYNIQESADPKDITRTVIFVNKGNGEAIQVSLNSHTHYAYVINLSKENDIFKQKIKKS